jgi:hypothetical protein
MITIDDFRKLALTFPETTEEPHFEKTSFRVQKKIFSTYDAKKHRACIKLALTDQDVFALADKQHFYAVDNAWGKQGWTLIELSGVKKVLFADALTSAYVNVAPKKLSMLVNRNSHT